jgi:hypothetical protein
MGNAICLNAQFLGAATVCLPLAGFIAGVLIAGIWRGR